MEVNGRIICYANSHLPKSFLRSALMRGRETEHLPEPPFQQLIDLREAQNKGTVLGLVECGASRWLQ